MIATAIEPADAVLGHQHSRQGFPRPRPQALALGLSCLGVLGLLAGCAEEPLPDRGLRRDDCLRELRLANLQERLTQCNAVVAAFPRDPAPLNDRYLLHSLAGNDSAACGEGRPMKAVSTLRGRG